MRAHLALALAATAACAHARVEGREPARAVPAEVRAAGRVFEGPSVRYTLAERGGAIEAWTEGVETCTGAPAPPARLTRHEARGGADVFVQWNADGWRVELVFPRAAGADGEAIVFERDRVTRRWPLWAR